MASVCSDLASLRRWRSIRPPAPTAASNDQGKINKTKIILSAQKRCAPNHHCSRSTQPSGQAAGCISASVATDLPTLACYQPKSSPARLPPFGGQTVHCPPQVRCHHGRGTAHIDRPDLHNHPGRAPSHSIALLTTPATRPTCCAVCGQLPPKALF